MVMAPEHPPAPHESSSALAWKSFAIGLLMLLAVGAVGLVTWLIVTGDSTTGGVVSVPIGPGGSSGQPGGGTTEGSGTIVTEALDLYGFTSIVLEGEGAIVVAQDDRYSASLTTDDNLIPLVTTEVIGSTLFLDTTASGTDIEPSDGLILEVATPQIERLEMAGAGSIRIDALRTETLTIDFSGAGLIEVGDLEATGLVVDADGAGSVKIAGTVDLQVVQLGGVASYEAGHLRSSSAMVTSDATNSAVLWVTDDLDVTLTNLGSVEYWGEPLVTSSATGTGQLIPLGFK
jgi:hypothetical protein